jgi:hypothetical protein
MASISERVEQWIWITCAWAVQRVVVQAYWVPWVGLHGLHFKA